jgi:excisionase family DNA binding protein
MSDIFIVINLMPCHIHTAFITEEKGIMMDEILDIRQAAEYLQIKERTLYRLVGDGEIPGIKVGGQWRFSKRCLEEMFLKVTGKRPKLKEHEAAVAE